MNEWIDIRGSSGIAGSIATVDTAGERIQLPNNVCREVTVIAKRGNSGYIYVGSSDVSSTKYGVELSAKDSFTFTISNTNMLYVDSTVSGDGISYVAV